MESVYTLTVKILEDGSGIDNLQVSLRSIALYCCRFLDRRQYRKCFKSIVSSKEELDQFLDIKDKLDHSTYKNQLSVALHTMAGFNHKTRRRFVEVAVATKVALGDLTNLFVTLTKQERKTLLRKFKDPIVIHSESETARLVKKLEPVIKGLSKHYLKYVSTYDLGQPIADIQGDLRMYATYVIRRYEVLNYSDEHLLKSTVQALQHNVLNMAGKFGRPRRRHISRTYKVEGCREAWHFNTTSLAIKKVLVEGRRSARKLTADGKLEVPVVYANSLIKPTYVPVTELYNKKEQAIEARLDRQRGCYSRKIPLISLVKDELDEYQLTHVSLLQERGEGVRLIDVLPNTSTVDRTDHFLGQLSRTASARLQLFAQLVLGQASDKLFEEWLEKVKHRDISSLTSEQLGRLASKYLRIPLSKLQKDVLATPSSLWTREERSIIDDCANNYGKADAGSNLVVNAEKLPEAYKI